MKRSQPLRSDPERTRAWQRRSARSWRSRRARTTVQRARWLDVVSAIQVRARGRCEAATAGAPGACAGPMDGHHRLPRSKGGRDVPSNALWVCRRHHDWIHQHPAAATELGLLEGVAR